MYVRGAHDTERKEDGRLSGEIYYCFLLLLLLLS